LAQLSRISDDIWDLWDNQTGKFPTGVKSQFERLAVWARYAKVGNWPDADMLPIGELRPHPDVGPGPRHTRLSLTEQQTQLTLWAIARSPLILGANLTLLDKQTSELIKNRDLIRINQTSLTSAQRLRDADLVVWSAELRGGMRSVAFFNSGENKLRVDKSLAELGLTGSSIQDVWSGARTEKTQRISVELPPHGSAAYLVMP
jgi:alpha-galactosidase